LFLVASASLSAKDAGGGGLNGITGPDANTTWRVTAPNSGTVDNRLPSFRNVLRLLGGAGDDTFVFAGGSPTSEISGGDGTNTIIGPDAGAAWRLDGPGAGSVNGTRFTAVARLVGGAGSDTFNLAGGPLAGGIDGG